VRVRRLELVDFRNYRTATVEPSPGLTVIVGANGQGKTNLVEALGYLATLESFRAMPAAALVRQGCDVAVVRGDVEEDDGRSVSVECEVRPTGRDRVLVNKQRLQRSTDLLGVLRVTVFSPDDLAIVKEGPAERRRLLDQTMVALQPRTDGLRRDLERILRQKATLLKQAGGRLGEDVAFTLDVWDAKLAEVGEALGAARAELVTELQPHVSTAYDELAERPSTATLTYAPVWRSEGLAAALAAARPDEVRRQVCLVGPHRDDLELGLNGLPARTHASQGEQRSLALALRLAAHRLVAARSRTSPVLVLDDVFSELDPARGRALLEHLPDGQVILTTSGPPPAGTSPGRLLRVVDGAVVADG
jgi:DNA replication and repair protein RecF